MIDLLERLARVACSVLPAGRKTRIARAAEMLELVGVNYDVDSDVVEDLKQAAKVLRHYADQPTFKVWPIPVVVALEGGVGSDLCVYCMCGLVGGMFDKQRAVNRPDKICHGVRSRCPTTMPHTHCKCRACNRDWLEATGQDPGGDLEAM